MFSVANLRSDLCCNYSLCWEASRGEYVDVGDFGMKFLNPLNGFEDLNPE